MHNSGDYNIGTRIKTNDPVNRSYYSHDPTAIAGHTAALVTDESSTQLSDEFAGQLNRHSACVDCHNPHSSDSTASVMTPLPGSLGWTASGRVIGATGVEVSNGGAATAPTYRLLGRPSGGTTREYQLCFKCHSGYTTIDNTGFESRPSMWWLDKGVELNPANPSFHPVEGAGTNQTPAMALSLTGTSPSVSDGLELKLWSFSTQDTVRCTNCHASDPRDVNAGAGQDSPPHVSSNRGILVKSYEDRVLKATGDPYNQADFELCYGCHTNQPFTSDKSRATNFPGHDLHISGMSTAGGSPTGSKDINALGDGSGNAICAECHFRLHSTTNSVGDTNANKRLVEFSPNVAGVGANAPAFTLGLDGDGLMRGTCAVTCHGHEHSADDYYTYTP